MPPVPEEIECDSGIPREVTERMEAAFIYFSERNYDAAMNTFVTLLEKHEEHAVFISKELPFILPWFHYLWEGERFLAFLQNAVRLHDYDVNSNHWLYYYYALMTNNEEILSEIIKNNPLIFVASMETTSRYFPHLREKFLEKVLSSQTMLKTDRLGFRALRYVRLGDFQAADRYFNKITQFYVNNIFPQTQKNYIKLADIAKAHNIMLVAMQYPVRSVRPLKAMLADRPEVIFVSNEKNFRQALKEYPIEEIFVDQFAGDFGHATYLGDWLIARNLARALADILQ